MAKLGRKGPFALKGGSLALVAVLLLGSGGLRLVSTAGPALALGGDMTKRDAEIVENPQSPPRKENMQAMLDAFQEREARLVERERAMEEREHALEIADKAVNQKLDELLQAEEALRNTLALADGAVEDDVARLTTVYETMKPKEAAALFEEMAPEFAAGFLARMRPDAAAEVMTGLSPQAAYTISVILAGRNSGAPIE